MKKWLLALPLLPAMAFADELNSGDTAWMLVATAFVMLMTPAGLALFYGGLTRSKNVLNTMGMSLAAYAIGTLVWVVAGYSIAFGDGDFIGTGKLMLSGIGADSLSGTIPPGSSRSHALGKGPSPTASRVVLQKVSSSAQETAGYSGGKRFASLGSAGLTGRWMDLGIRFLYTTVYHIGL